MPEPNGHPASWSPLFEALPQGVLLLDQEGRFLEANAAALKLLDIDRQSLRAHRLGDGRWDLLAPDGSVLPLAETPGALTLRTGKPVHRQAVGVVKADGDVLWLEISAEPTGDSGALITFEDITRHHLAESILASRARIAELAATATLEQILRATLDEAERLTGSSIGFCHFMEADQKTLTLQAWSTRTENEFCHAEGHGMHYAVDKAGVWVDAVHARKPVIHNDYATLPHRKGMPKGHATVLRELVVPVLREERIVALLGVGNKPFPYGNRDLQTVQRLADLAWDIAERKRSEVALRQSEADYRTLFENMAEGAFRQGADGSLVDVNDAALELLGLTRDEFLERTSMHPDWDVVDGTGHPISGSEHPSMLALATGQRVTGRLLGVTHRRSGARVWLEVNAIPEFRSGDPRPYRVMVTLHDLTERRKLEASLLESETRWHTVVEQAGDGFELLDEEGRFLQVNGASCRALGFSREELLQMSLTDIDPIVTHEEYRRGFQSLIGKPPITVETIHRRKDGTEFPAEVTVSIIRFEGCLRALAQARDISDRKRSEAAVQAAKNLLDQVLDSLEAHVAVLDLQGNIIAVNEPWRWFAHANGIQETIGCVEQVNYLDVLDRSSQETPCDTAAIRQGLADVLAGHRSSFQAEYPCDSPTEQRWFRMQVLPLQSAKGGAVVTHENITEEKLAATALARSETRARAMLQTAMDGVWLIDGEGRFQEVNEAACRLVGHSLEELRTMRVADLEVQESPEEVLLHLARIRDRGWDQFESRLRRRDGTSFPVDLSVTSLPALNQLVAFFRDISARRQAEQALRESEAQYRGLFDSMKEGFALHEIITDEEGRPVDYRFLDVNPAFVAMTGLPRDHWLGRTVLEILPGTEPRWIREYGQVALTGQPVTFEDESNDLGRWYRVNAYQPAPRQFAVLVTDITAQKRSDLERARLEQQIAKTQKMESLGSLAGGVAHDMNNVLGAIMGLASIHQEQEPVGSRLRRSMDTILKACTRGRTLVKGLLGFARQGLEEVRLLDLNDVVREDVALLERTIPATIQLKVDLAGGLRAIHGDPSSLSHVLMNLCVNAIDAMPGGGVLRIQTRNLEPDEVELEVSDTGCGMPPEVLEKALDPFFTTKGQGKGTGLGLAIVYGTVKAHHGRLGLDSKVGCGTRVNIQFPATLTEAVAELPGPQQPRGGPSLSLLVIDDDELIQESLSGLLHAMGHSATLAVSGEEALQRLREGLQVHCVMLDLNMPGLGGSGTLPLLRAAYPDLPVLLATGRADQTAMDLVARHARTLLLPKPFTTEEIAGHLRQLGLG